LYTYNKLVVFHLSHSCRASLFCPQFIHLYFLCPFFFLNKQGIDPDPSSNSGFQPTRALFAFFPTYRSSPLPATWDRIVHAGDASGIQSPLSFGGFGALTRHLARITGALGEALDLEEQDENKDALSAKSLSQCNPYMPNLAVKVAKHTIIP
jgi:hypothetical protein